MDFVVLSSSRGTTFQAILDRIADGSLQSRCLGLVADKEDRGCVAKAKAFGLPCTIVERKKGEQREDYDKRVDTAIRTLAKNVQQDRLIIAAIGWMFLLSPWFVRTWKNRILNVHPALLPKHVGAHAHEEVLAAGDTESGMTIHLIDEGMDTGPIVLQKKCPVLPGDTPDTLKARVQELEKEWYPKVIEMIANGELKI